MATKLYIYDASSLIDRIQAAGRFEGERDVLSIGIDGGFKEFQSVLDRLRDTHQQFNRFLVQTHGGAGRVWFGDDFIDKNVWSGTLAGHNYDQLFPKFTRVYFDGCNVAEGGAGTDFLLNAGYVLLIKGGGDVIGWKNLGFGMPGLFAAVGGHTLHFGGSKNLKRIRFWKGGEPNWPGSFVY